MDLKEVTGFLTAVMSLRVMRIYRWGCGSYKEQIRLGGNWLPCAVPHWSSRGYQNIMLGTVITMSRGVIKDKVGEMGCEGNTKKPQQEQEWKMNIEGKKIWRRREGEAGKSINLYMQPWECPLSASDSQPKGSNSHQTNSTSFHRATLIISHPSLPLSPFTSFGAPPNLDTLQTTGPSPPNLTHSFGWELAAVLLMWQRSDQSPDQDKGWIKTVITQRILLPVCQLSHRVWDWRR